MELVFGGVGLFLLVGAILAPAHGASGRMSAKLAAFFVGGSLIGWFLVDAFDLRLMEPYRTPALVVFVLLGTTAAIRNYIRNPSRMAITKQGSDGGHDGGQGLP